jgi:UMF1 family MFS transporter
MLPVVGILGRVILPGAISGIRQLAFPVINMAAGGGTVIALNATFSRQNNLLAILALMLALQLVGLIFAYLFGRRWFDALANRLDTQRGILLALAIYAVVAAWGFILDSTVEFWMLGLMIAMVQGGSMALSRSLFARLSPRAKSGEFFGLYGVMEKFASIVGPLVFVLAGFLFQNSRPALLLMVGFFFVGGWLLMRVDVEAGQRLARAKDEALLGATSDG